MDIMSYFDGRSGSKGLVEGFYDFITYSSDFNDYMGGIVWADWFESEGGTEELAYEVLFAVVTEDWSAYTDKKSIGGVMRFLYPHVLEAVEAVKKWWLED